MPNLRKIEAAVPAIREKKKVAAYARVSMQSERMLHSLSAQVSYYSGLIQKNPDWEYAGVYADDFISGTNTVKRDEFKRMLADCEAGKIDIILTKSISRFARNTVDLLETVRRLKDLGVEVRFEKERIRSMDGDGELMLTILASFAQEESRSISDNVKWGIRKRMQNGIPNGHFRIYGYRWEGDELVIVPEEAEIVKRIFQNFLDGKSRLETERELAAEGIDYRGCLYGGFMLTPAGPKVLEFNARFGDPETQVVLPRLKNDLVEVMLACANCELDQIELDWRDEWAVAVVLTSAGYPGSYEKGKVITGIEDAEAMENVTVYHAGTAVVDGQLVTNGGRVLAVTALGDTFENARNLAYEACEKIDFEGKTLRHDIGLRALRGRDAWDA